MMAMMKIMITNNIIMKKTTNGSSGGASAVGMAMMMTLGRFAMPKKCRRVPPPKNLAQLAIKALTDARMNWV